MLWKYVAAICSALALTAAQEVNLTCPDYLVYSTEYHAPFSQGIYNLSSQRPDSRCRSFNLTVVEDAIERVSGNIADPDLKQLFINTYPNTMDTAIAWKGYADNGTEEELTFIITGDINAMWLRDSANQVQSYLPLLEASSDPQSLASIYRGVINLQSRYIQTDPYCNAFQPPVESGIGPDENTAASEDDVKPEYNNQTVFECKYELDSLAAFLEVSRNYYNATEDLDFFGRFQWVQAIEDLLDVAEGMMIPTYSPNGSVNSIPYTFTRLSERASETTRNDGLGSPVNSGTGLIRSFFRPSDDSTIFQFLIPSNMMFASYLEPCADIMDQLSGQSALAERMHTMATNVRAAIEAYGTTLTRDGCEIYAFETDGYSTFNIMDDANIPSLLSAPFYDYVDKNDPLYRRTRELLLSTSNPYYNVGPVINGIGGPHQGPGMAWPMAMIMRVFTTDDDAEISSQLQQLVSSTDGLGLMHESINTHNVTDWTRQWFSWTNGLFGQMILDLNKRKPELLGQSFQGNASMDMI